VLATVPILLLTALHQSSTDTTVYEDSFGVPSIMASSLPEAIYALGYGEAKEQAVQMAMNYKLARGRMAEVNGRSGLLQDGFLRTMGFESRAQAEASTMSGETRKILDSFVSGANRALAEHKGELPKWIEPFTAVDVIAFTQFINAAFPLLDLSQKISPGAGSNQFALSPSRTATRHPILSIIRTSDLGIRSVTSNNVVGRGETAFNRLNGRS